jgi:hypothetical protein
MYYVNQNADLTEAQRKIIEDQLNSKAGRGFVKHASQQKSVRMMESKGYCKAQYALDRGILFDLTVKISVTESLPFGSKVDVSPNK